MHGHLPQRVQVEERISFQFESQFLQKLEADCENVEADFVNLAAPPHGVSAELQNLSGLPGQFLAIVEGRLPTSGVNYGDEVEGREQSAFQSDPVDSPPKVGRRTAQSRCLERLSCNERKGSPTGKPSTLNVKVSLEDAVPRMVGGDRRSTRLGV